MRGLRRREHIGPLRWFTRAGIGAMIGSSGRTSPLCADLGRDAAFVGGILSPAGYAMGQQCVRRASSIACASTSNASVCAYSSSANCRSHVLGLCVQPLLVRPSARALLPIV